MGVNANAVPTSQDYKNENHGPQKLSRKAGVFDVSLCCSSEQLVPRHNIYFEKASAWLWGLGYKTHKSEWHSGLQHLSLLFITEFTHLRWVGELSLWAWIWTRKNVHTGRVLDNTQPNSLVLPTKKLKPKFLAPLWPSVSPSEVSSFLPEGSS